MNNKKSNVVAIWTRAPWTTSLTRENTREELICSVVILRICYNLPLEKDGAFHLHKLESHSSKDACTMFCVNWLSGIGIIYFNFVNEFPLFRYYLPLEKDGDLHLNKLESPSPKDDFCQVWTQWFWRRRFLKILLSNFTIS